MKLNELYRLKLMNYRINGVREQPDKLLAMLLLPEKDQFEPLVVDNGHFYEFYKDKIDEKIEKVIQDFELSDNNIIQYLLERLGFYNDLQDDMIWYVFSEGFLCVHSGVLYHKEESPEQLYERFFEGDDLKETDEVRIRYKKLYEDCRQYPEIQLSQPKPFDIDRDWETIVEGGFIEKYCLSEGEVAKVKELRIQKQKMNSYMLLFTH